MRASFINKTKRDMCIYKNLRKLPLPAANEVFYVNVSSTLNQAIHHGRIIVATNVVIY